MTKWELDALHLFNFCLRCRWFTWSSRVPVVDGARILASFLASVWTSKLRIATTWTQYSSGGGAGAGGLGTSAVVRFLHWWVMLLLFLDFPKDVWQWCGNRR